VFSLCRTTLTLRVEFLRVFMSFDVSFRYSHGCPSVVEWYAIVHGLRSLRNCEAPTLCHRVRIMLLAELWSSCSLRSCVGYAPYGRMQVRLLAERLAFGHFGPFRVLGLSQLLIVWSCPNEAKARTIKLKPDNCSEGEKGKEL
nr:hypothetical protein [Tanacetum cinerariifolium]